MASSLLLLLPLLILLLSPTALSQTCKTPNFKTPNKTFTSCTDLPRLSATLHYTFNASSSLLSMAFTAAPAAPSGWVSWAINPSASGMSGSQALIAYTNRSSSAIAVSSANIKSYQILQLASLSIQVSDVSGESSDGKITLFATWRLPNGTSTINQVWQVGAEMRGLYPAAHIYAEENLKSMSKLSLNGESPPPSPPPPGGGNSAAAAGIGRFGVWTGFGLGVIYVVLMLV